MPLLWYLAIYDGIFSKENKKNLVARGQIRIFARAGAVRPPLCLFYNTKHLPMAHFPSPLRSLAPLMAALLLATIPSFAQLHEPGALWVRGVGTDARTKGAELSNFNPIPDVLSVPLVHEWPTEGAASLFMAFRPDGTRDVALVELEAGGEARRATTLGLLSPEGDSTAYGPLAGQSGAVVSYLAHFDGPPTDAVGRLSLGDLAESVGEGGGQRLLELLLLPRTVDGTERRQVETYLSLRHGISLDTANGYLGGNGKVVWDKDAERACPFRVTGIGRDGVTGLDQRQSRNASAEGLLTVGLGGVRATNADNPNRPPDGAYLLWGDNGGALSFTAAFGGVAGARALGREWSARASGAPLGAPLAIRLSKEKLPLPEGEGSALWLAVSPGSGAAARWYAPTGGDNSFVEFSGVDICAGGHGERERFGFVLLPPGALPPSTMPAPAPGAPFAGQWGLWPNIVETGAPFQLWFELEAPAEIEARATDASGRLVWSRRYGRTASLRTTERLPLAGSYLVTVLLDGVPSTRQLTALSR